jgi:hypothetical protein
MLVVGDKSRRGVGTSFYASAVYTPCALRSVGASYERPINQSGDVALSCNDKVAAEKGERFDR